MYIRLSKIMKKDYFRKILDEAIIQAKHEFDSYPDIKLNESILLQLVDIKKQVVENGVRFSEDEAYERYSLGILALRNFGGEDENDYPKKLSDIAWGISYYPSMA